MKSTCTIRRGQAAYTMVELMVAMLISVTLMVAMYQIFARVQKIFTEGNHRGKMDEEGRAVMDLIVRDLEQIAPSGTSKFGFIRNSTEWGFNPPPTTANPNPEPVNYHPFYGCNFMAWPYASTDLNATKTPADYKTWRIETQQAWEAAISETLVSSRVEFFARDVLNATDKQWRVMGYRLYSQNNPVIRNTEIIGALWRYESNPGPKEGALGLLNTALDLRRNGDLNYRKLSDNVIHFRMRAVSRDDPGRALWEKPYFDNKDVPLYVEVELGIIGERLKEEILNDAKVEEYDMKLEFNPSDGGALKSRLARIQELLEANTDRILMLRQIVPITSAMGN